MYKVIKHFIDLHDNDHSYNEGDIFPREGVDVSEFKYEINCRQCQKRSKLAHRYACQCKCGKFRTGCVGKQSEVSS